MLTGNQLFLLVLVMGLSITSSIALAEVENNETQATEEETPQPVELTGVFEATNRTAYSVRPKEWSEYIVVEAVPHGATVRAGQVLIRFESEAIDDHLEDLARQFVVEELALRQAKQELEHSEKSLPLKLAQARRTEELAVEDLANFVKVDRPQQIQDLAYTIEQSENYLNYEREELDQLEKMYKADDLTEETEEIILARAQHSVKAAEFNLQRSKLREQRALNIELPREEQDLKKSVRETALELEKLTAIQPIELNRAKLDLEQQKTDYEKQSHLIEKLKADRELLTIKATQDGFVYYGDTVAGNWPEIAQMRKSLRPGNTVPTNQVLMNVVAARPLFVRATFSEDHLHELRKGLKVKVNPHGYPDLKLDARVAQISPIPVADGEFEAIVEVKFGETDATLVPGMGVKVILPLATGKKE